ncbi:MAG: hypothetical protein WCB27_03400 [Thermoguttaceae bacterium]
MVSDAQREVEGRRAQFRKQVQEGVEELDRGEGITVAAGELRAFFDDIQSRGRQRYEASKKVQ